MRKIIVDGTIVRIDRGFLRVAVELGGREREVLAYISGKMKRNKISLAAGDKVRLEIPTVDCSRGRIIRRLG